MDAVRGSHHMLSVQVGTTKRERRQTSSELQDRISSTSPTSSSDSNSSATSELTTTTSSTNSAHDDQSQILKTTKRSALRDHQRARATHAAAGMRNPSHRHNGKHKYGDDGLSIAPPAPPPPPPPPKVISAVSGAAALNRGEDFGTGDHGSTAAPDSPQGGGPTQITDRSTRLLVALFLIGLIVCVTSIACILLLPSLVSNQIAKKLVLKNNSMLLERWSKPNVPMYFKVWLYDIKNAQEILDGKPGAGGSPKPRVEEIGPFVFNLRRQKDVISFAGDNLYYTERKVFHFNRKLSCCAINTTVTIPNIPLVAVVDRALGYNLPLLGRFIPRLINRAIGSLREQLFVRKQVREILFDGYDVELLKMVSRIGSLVGLPQQSQKFALLKGRNDTWRPEQDGVWAINTGQRDRRQFGRVASWNSYKKLPFWNAAQCNVINGSDGTLFPPPIKRTEPLYIFNQELCRTVNLVFDKPSDVRSIQALRFVLNPMNFAHTMTSGGGGTASQQAPEAPPVFRNGLPAAALTRLAGVAQRENGATNTQPGLGGGVVSPNNRQSERPRINPLFQNPRLAPLLEQPPVQAQQVVPPQQAAPLLEPSSSKPVMTPAGAFQAQQMALRNRQPSLRRISTAPADGVPLQSAGSERRAFRRERATHAAATETAHTSPQPHQHQQASSASTETTNDIRHQTSLDMVTAAAPPDRKDGPSGGVASNMNSEAAIRSQQEKLIQVAQEAQLASERKSKLNPQTCFCDRKTTNLNGVNVCEFDGLIDLSKCSKQAQVIFGSMPHFYNSDPRLLNQVVGMEPNASRHTTYLDIEPNTGLVLGGKRRVQLNVIIKHNNEIDGFENINDMLVPIVWFEESALIPEETAQKFRSMYVDKIRLINLILFSLLTASVALLIVDARLLVTTRRWRQFKLMRLGGTSGGEGGLFVGVAPTADKPKTPTGGRRVASDATIAPRKRLAANGAPATANSNRLRDQRQRQSGGRLASAPLVVQLTHAARQAAYGGANSPLLASTSSAATSTSACSSPSVTPPGSPQDSPELRKWSPGGGGGRMLTRVHLNATDANMSGNMNMHMGGQVRTDGQQAAAKADAAKGKSIIELAGGNRRALH